MTRLGDLAATVKSANAGATWLTLDIGFADADAYRLAVHAPALTSSALAPLYAVPVHEVHVYPCDGIRTIKITLPRPVVDGGVAETDFDGTQQFVPLLGLDVPDAE